jgi:hypothetical protein
MRTLQIYMRESKVETSTEGSDLMKKLLLIGAILFTSTSALFAQGANTQTLAISEIVKTVETEPAIFEVTVKLIDASTAVLRMNVFTAQTLAAQLGSIGR